MQQPRRANGFERTAPACRRSIRDGGFTLIELMIAIAVVAILAGIAMPAYQDQVRRGHRASAQAAMLDVAARQRQFVIDRRAYATSLTELGLTLPSAITDRYAVTVEAPGDARPPTFRIVATPRGGQSADRCGALTVDQTGSRLPAGCW